MQNKEQKYFLLSKLEAVKDAERGDNSLNTESLKGRRVSWDEVREWHGHIYTTKCKIDS